MSDHPLISRWCEDAAFDYTNTFLDEPPKLDITAVPPSRRGTVDVLISSDVLEHVMFPIADALRGMFDCLVPGGHLVLTCPYRKRGPSTEHFPWVRSYRVTETGIVVGADADGLELKLEDPVFHGGSGKTLEMRMLSLAVLVQELRTIGFDPIDVLDEPVPGLGIFPTDEMGVLVCRRPEGTS